MTARLIAVYRKPDDPDTFDTHYNDVHLPLARTMPGIRKVEVHRARKALIGDDDNYIVTVMHFDDAEALERATSSEEGMAAGKDAYKLSGGTVKLFVAECEEVQT
ncbi:MAG TPA: EthD family reductase [Actinomycetota bacterium]|nr:EthD family reductase [Actinomycetota bacterium]